MNVRLMSAMARDHEQMPGLDDIGIPAPSRVPDRVRLGRATFDVSHIQVDAKGQDTLLVGDGFVAVADGSTPLDRSRGGVVADFAKAALKALQRNRHLGVRQQFERAIRSVGGGYDDLTTPTCGVGCVQTRGLDIEAVALADVTIVIKQTGGVYTVLRDDRVAFYDDRSALAMKAQLDQGVDLAAARESIQPLIQDQFHNHRNREGGYWVFGNNPEAANQAITIRVPEASVEAILICSDGFARLCDLFTTARGPEHLLELASRHPLAEMAAELRRLEALPDSMVTNPRTSVYDDATAVFIRRR